MQEMVGKCPMSDSYNIIIMSSSDMGWDVHAQDCTCACTNNLAMVLRVCNLEWPGYDVHVLL